MTTRDGTRLDADVYTPDAPGEFPVLLMRQPYGRAIASTVVYAHPTWYAAHGYIVVIQDVRGRGTSEGTFTLFENEVADGEDTVAWAAQLPQSNGRVGMYGFSYQGMTQLYAAQAQPPALVAIAPAMVGYHPYKDWAYENGALCLQGGLGWAIQLAVETARLKGDREAYQALYRASRQLPFHDPVPACPEVLVQYAPDSFFHTWLAHPTEDAYWARITPDLSQVDLPMLHIGGWFDPYLRGDVRLYREMGDRSRHPQPFWVGPWSHIPWGRQAGIRNFGAAADNPVDALQIRWFDQMLKEQDTGLLAEPPVCLFELGSDRWRKFDQWPQGHEREWGLASTGLAAMRQDAGRLYPLSEGNSNGDGIPEGDRAPLAPPTRNTFVHDPWRPVPSLGGHAAFPPGVVNRAALDCRSDVLTYTTEGLAEPLSIAGDIALVVTCMADTPSFDLCAVLSEVHPDGAVHTLTQGYGRFVQPPGDPQPCQIPLQPSCFCIAPGRALRLSLSAASFPAYGVNSGHEEANSKRPGMDAQIITLSVLTGDGSATQLRLNCPATQTEGLN